MSGAASPYCLAEIEKWVCDRLYHYYEMKEALDLEKEERSLSRLQSTLGKKQTRGSRVGNPTLSQFLRITDPIKSIELPDMQVMEEYQEKGKKKIRLKKISGISIQDPVKWIRLIDSLKEIFRGSVEGEILENYFFKKKKLSESAAFLKITKSQVRIGISKILGLAVGLAMMGDLR